MKEVIRKSKLIYSTLPPKIIIIKNGIFEGRWTANGLKNFLIAVSLLQKGAWEAHTPPEFFRIEIVKLTLLVF